MGPFLQGFVQELEKQAGVLSTIGKAVVKHPLLALGGGSVAASTVAGAVSGAKSGLHAGETGQYLRASKDGPSDAFYTNYHPMFPHKMTPAEKMHESWNYHENEFKR